MGGTGKKAGINNGTVSDGGTVSDIVIGTCGEKYETESKNVTLADTKYFLVEGL